MEEIENKLNSTAIKAEINVHEFSHYPRKAWQLFSCAKNGVQKLPIETPIFENKVRVVCISDTHAATSSLKNSIPKADILIHAGDFLKHGTMGELEEFRKFLSSLTHIKYKIVIAGNHDVFFDTKYEKPDRIKFLIDRYLKNYCTYLQDSWVKLFGLKIYGSPWQPVHCENAFQLERGQPLLDKWNKIPDDTDILVTHGPPLGYGDKIGAVKHVGCVDLLNTVINRVRPKFHVFGHIHEDYGIWTNDSTTFINACICNRNYFAAHDPILFDIDLPDNNKTKKDFLNEN